MILLLSTGAIVLISVGTGIGLAGGFLLGKLREMKKRRRDLKKLRKEEKEMQEKEKNDEKEMQKREREQQMDEDKHFDLIRKYEEKKNAGEEL